MSGRVPVHSSTFNLPLETKQKKIRKPQGAVQHVKLQQGLERPALCYVEIQTPKFVEYEAGIQNTLLQELVKTS
jgi:hypothetical protein